MTPEFAHLDLIRDALKRVVTWSSAFAIVFFTLCMVSRADGLVHQVSVMTPDNILNDCDQKI